MSCRPWFHRLQRLDVSARDPLARPRCSRAMGPARGRIVPVDQTFVEEQTSASTLFWEVLRTTTQVEPVPPLPKPALRSTITLPKVKHRDHEMETAIALQESLAVAAFEQSQLPDFRRQASVKDGLGWSAEAPTISSIPKELRQRDAILRYFSNLKLTDCSIEVRPLEEPSRAERGKCCSQKRARAPLPPLPRRPTEAHGRAPA